MTNEIPPTPEGYQEPVRYPKPEKLLNGISIAALIVLVWITDLLGHLDRVGGVWVALSLIVVLVVSVFIHEMIHYAAHLATGYDPTLRIWPPSVWSEGVLVPRRHNLIHLISPFIVVNAIGAILWFAGAGYWSFVGHFVVLENTVGSFGDLYGVGYNLIQKPDTRIAVLQENVQQELVYKPG